ncbi:MAG: DUF2225 domain-containing protein [Halanaerobiales bacterium]|nr:DUF2225 domain-containing protein [Halanaerobiales bacterium]
MSNHFYKKKVTCPICLTPFHATVVKSNKCVSSGKDSDFRYIYPNITPYLYDIWVCPQCFYASPKGVFNEIKPNEVNKIAQILATHQINMNPLGERKLETALISNKLALLTLSYRKVPASTIAGVCLKTAWIYRMLKNTKNERIYLEKALSYYEEVYSTEHFPIGGLTHLRAAYLIAEINRRLDNYEESIRRFDQVVRSPLAKSEPLIVRMARDQWSLAKKQLDKIQKIRA